VIHLRKTHPVFHRRRYFIGQPISAETDLADIGWFKPDGEQMSQADWDEGYAKSIGVFLNGEAIPSPGSRGEPIIDDSFYLLFNASEQDVQFRLPVGRWGESWADVLDTALTPSFLTEESSNVRQAGDEFTVKDRSLVVLKRVDPED
jgi:glycogen operon protein